MTPNSLISRMIYPDLLLILTYITVGHPSPFTQQFLLTRAYNDRWKSLSLKAMPRAVPRKNSNPGPQASETLFLTTMTKPIRNPSLGTATLSGSQRSGVSRPELPVHDLLFLLKMAQSQQMNSINRPRSLQYQQHLQMMKCELHQTAKMSSYRRFISLRPPNQWHHPRTAVPPGPEPS